MGEFSGKTELKLVSAHNLIWISRKVATCCPAYFRDPQRTPGSLFIQVVRCVQRSKAIDEINEDIYQLKLVLEQLKQHQQHDDDDEKGDEGKDAEAYPDNDDR